MDFAAGIEVFDGLPAIVIERFDRTPRSRPEACSYEAGRAMPGIRLNAIMGMGSSPHAHDSGKTLCSGKVGPMNIDRNLRTRTRLLLAVPIAAAAFSLAACSGAAERPSAADLAAGITTIFDDGAEAGDIPQETRDLFDEEAVNCIADYLLDSEISDKDLANLADGKDVQTSQEANQLVQSTMSQASMECITAE